ncbi:MULTISPECIES: 2TM domain-containing protein [unclassified Myroides]|uniref:2TM domain-containing protein n=1 Tax=unclassified Myroides TaxID=2642485 RepID=UPI0015FC1E9E|nr:MULTISPECIES: 2TM domain-containing protein [unclassified Myroides]MBB1148844.1 2TM domain-containing protein [Myroides sp. NP-2]MDM1406556.1 2TM domain-containing protein [Myroides sp. DF42-4-2]
MEKIEAIKQYEYAKNRIKQRKMLLFHFVVFLLGSLVLYAINMWVKDPQIVGVWWPYVVGAWALLLLFHLINVVVVNRFMGPAWQEREIERLVSLQQEKIKQLRAKVEKDFPLVDVKRDLNQEDTKY